jgi:hypothetical protein
VQLGQQAHAVAVRQPHVGQQQVDRLALDDRLGLAEVAGGDEAAVVRAREHVADQLDQRRLVVHDEDPGTHVGLGWLLDGRSHFLFPLSLDHFIRTGSSRVRSVPTHRD